eukprot:gene67605-92605_t
MLRGRATGREMDFIRRSDEIDAMWIESMNSVIIDYGNNILTLINGDRMNSAHELDEFSVRDAPKTFLRVASPATVSRAGMIYIDATELGWRTYTESWVTTKFKNNEESKIFEKRLLPKLLKFKEMNCHVPDFERIDALGADYNAITEKALTFAPTWS